MKILHIAEFGKRATGIGTVVERLQKEQLALGHDVRIVTISENIAYKHLELYTCYTKSDLKHFFNSWVPDAVLFHSIWAMPYISFSKLLLQKGIPYAIMMHGADSKINRQSSPIKKWIANFIWFNRFMKDASAIVYLSDAEKKNCLSTKNNKNNIIIPNGCDKGDFDINSISLKKPANIVFLGRLEKFSKGIDVLLDALVILKTRNVKNVRINFYANENDIDIQYLKDRLVSLDGIASYHGGVYGIEKSIVLKEADAFILTSRSEGMPMGVLEAISYGVPCILTSGTNMADELKQVGAGWKTELDPISIADTILRAVDDLSVNYSQYHKAAYKLSSNYEWDKVGKLHVNLMSQICKKKRL